MSVRITPLIDPDGDLSSHRRAWLASDTEGIPVGAAFLRLFTSTGQEHLAELDLRVHPAERHNRTGYRRIVQGTNEGLDAARARGARLGGPPAMTDEQVRHARDLLAREELQGAAAQPLHLVDAPRGTSRAGEASL